MKPILFLAGVTLFTACDHASKTDAVVVTDTAAGKTQTDSSANYIHTFPDTALENKITTALLKLPFVNKNNAYIDSFSHHRHGIAFMLENPQTKETDISVQAGYNGDQRFETYYRFSVDPKTLEIKVYDPVNNKKLTVQAYINSQK